MGVWVSVCMCMGSEPLSQSEHGMTALLHSSLNAHELRSVSAKAKVLTQTLRLFVPRIAALNIFIANILTYRWISILGTRKFAIWIVSGAFYGINQVVCACKQNQSHSIVDLRLRCVNKQLRSLHATANVSSFCVCVCVYSVFAFFYFSLEFVFRARHNCDTHTHTAANCHDNKKQVARTWIRFAVEFTAKWKKTKSLLTVCERALMWIWLRACLTYRRTQ